MAERETFKPEVLEPVRYGDALTIVGGHFAQDYDNNRLLASAINFGLEESQVEVVKKAIESTGFTHRYFSRSPEEAPDVQKTLDKTVKIGAKILKETLRAQKWDGVDLFIDTSAFLPTQINAAVLVEAGINPDRVVSKSYRYACAGAVGAFIDTVSRPEYHGARVVIAALEPLSHLVNPKQFLSPATVAFPSIFGDAYTAMAFNPERFEIYTKNILIQPDGGVIKLKTMYGFDKSSDSKTPDYYKFAGGGENIFSFSEKGAVLNIPVPDNGDEVSMDGMATGFFFGDQTASVISGLIEQMGNTNLLKEIGTKNVILHAASKPVVDRIAKLLKRHPKKYLDTPEIPFLMDVAGYSNGSSATTLNRLKYMIQNNMIDPGKPVMWIAPGIGSAIAGAVGKIHP